MNRTLRRRCWVVVSIWLLTVPNLAWAQVDQQRADTYFKEAAALCEREGGRLWGVSLCGPMVFADAATRSIATNQPTPTANRPPQLGFVQAPIEWAGTRWAAYRVGDGADRRPADAWAPDDSRAVPSRAA